MSETPVTKRMRGDHKPHPLTRSLAARAIDTAQLLFDRETAPHMMDRLIGLARR